MSLLLGHRAEQTLGSKELNAFHINSKQL